VSFVAARPAGEGLAEIVDDAVDAPCRVSLEERESIEHDHGIHAPGSHSTSVPQPTVAFPRGCRRRIAKVFPNGTKRFETKR
jgi:hypothetical protein